VRSAHFTVGPHGKRVTAGIPGTGLFYTSTLPGAKHSGGGRTTPERAGGLSRRISGVEERSSGSGRKIPEYSGGKD